jgi:kynurenine formamidase
MERLVDLSHTIEHGLETYRGLPAPILSDFMSRERSRAHYAPGTEFHIGKIEMVANTGTYLDSPFHRHADGDDLAGLGLERLADLEGLVVRHVVDGGCAGAAATLRADPSRASLGRAIDAAEIVAAATAVGLDLEGKAVLFHTGWDRHWRTERYFSGHPFLSAAAAQLLVDRGVALAGIDSLNVDDTADLTRPAHTLLLAAGIPIVEHMTNLSALPDHGFHFFAVPPKVKSFGTFPVRAFARLT